MTSEFSRQPIKDPLWYYANSSNQPVGPHALADLQRLAHEGTIQPETQVFQEGGSQWRAFAEISPTPSSPPVFEKPRSEVTLTPLPNGRHTFNVISLCAAPIRGLLRYSLTKRQIVKLFGAALSLLLLGAVFHFADNRNIPAHEKEVFVFRGTELFEDEQAIRETSTAMTKRDKEKKQAARTTPTDTVELYEPTTDSVDEETAKLRASDSENYARLKQAGRIGTTGFDFSAQIVRDGGASDSVLLRPITYAEKFKHQQFWVLRSQLHPMDSPIAKALRSRKTVKSTDMVFVFHGRNGTGVGSADVLTLADFVAGIYEGKIPMKLASQYLFKDGAISGSMTQRLDTVLIFETYTYSSFRRRVDFALKRDPGVDESSNPLYQGAMQVTGLETFTTQAGFVRQIPVVEVVNVAP